MSKDMTVRLVIDTIKKAMKRERGSLQSYSSTVTKAHNMSPMTILWQHNHTALRRQCQGVAIHIIML